ncbi:Ribosomal RNA-processing protein 1-like protein [Yarrowia sp. C11]|nr:Ribosomal RNA-processing protein 1-like protein [Yarrowia sp. E02]KAG5369286.1 Ribosomal RNA-processing protein 1-like protein [Yarrowia sp. C11]
MAGKVKKGSKKTAVVKTDKPYDKKEDNSAADIQLGSPDAYPFIKKLAANDRPTRDETLNSLKRFLGTPKAFGELELLKLWKGLFFSMWFSDRPRTQQRLADDMASLLLVVHETNYFTFLSSFWKIMSSEWMALDKHRIDKFYLLLRRYVGYAFQRLAKEGWDESWIERHNEVMSKIPLNPENPKIPDSIRYHVLEIYLDELAKVVLKDQKETEDEEEAAEQVKELFSDVPVAELLEAVESLSEESKNKVVQQRCVEDVLENPLLIEWGVAEELEGEQEDEEEEDEWEGFV